MAVGDHILLGGDNMDLALAHMVRQKLEQQGNGVDRWQQASLVHACRAAKERLLSDASLAAAPIAIASRGSALLGATLRTELARDEVTRRIVEGFFPGRGGRRATDDAGAGGLTQLGLPYASDPAVTRHLAAFLARQAGALGKLEGFARPPRDSAGERAPRLLHPTALLFNGGVMKADPLRDRLVETLNVWLSEDGGDAVRVLEGADLDLAVARGACAYALVRRGEGPSNPRRHGAGLLRRHRERRPRRARGGAARDRAVRRALRDGRGDGGRAATPRARRRRRRAGSLPILRFERTA